MSTHEKRPAALLVALAAVAVLVWSQHRQPNVPTPDVPAPPADAPDMQAVFARNSDRAAARIHATRAASLFGSLAGTVEYDARLTAPRLATAAVVEDARVLTRDYWERGGSYAATYPDFGPTVAAYLEAKVGADGGTLTPERRQAWVSAYQGLAAACAHAAGRL